MAEMSWGQIKSSGNGEGTPFLKLQSGENKVRVVSLPYELEVHWEKTVDGSNKKIVCLGNGCPLCKAGHVPTKRYQSLVIDRNDGVVKILEGGNSIFSQIKQYATDEDYGDPTKYDLKIRKEGSGRETKYTVMASPNKGSITPEEQKAVDAVTPLIELNKPKTAAEIMQMGLEAFDNENWTNVDDDNKTPGDPKDNSDDWGDL